VSRFWQWLGTGVALVNLTGCGTYVPEMQNFWQNKDAGLVQVDVLRDHVSCEIISAVQIILAENEEANKVRAQNGLPTVNLSDITTWVAEVLLTLTVDERSQFNPSAALNDIYPNVVKKFSSGAVTVGQTGSLGLAGQFSSDGTRKITVAYGLSLHDYLIGPRARKLAAAAQTGTRCSKPGGVFTDGDLKFKDTLESALVPEANNKEDIYSSDYLRELATAEKATKKDVIAHEVTFVVVYGVNATPSIKLVNVSANQGASSFLGVQRTNTQDVTITIGPAVAGQPNLTASNTILASQINIGTVNAILKLGN